MQQYLVAAGEVDEDLGDTTAQVGLAHGGFDGGPLHGVECEADLADLVLLVLQTGRLGLDVDLFTGGETAHHAGQPHPGDLVGLLAQPAQVADELPADAYGHHQGHQQSADAEQRGDPGLGEDPEGGGPHPVLEFLAGVGAHHVEAVERPSGVRAPPGGGSGDGGASRVPADR